MKRLLLILAAVAILLPAHAAKSNKELIDSVNQKLACATTLTDSLRLYYDLFDLTTIYDTQELADTILSLALRAGDEYATYDILRRLVRINRENETLSLKYENIIKEMKPSEQQLNTFLYARINNTIHAVRNSDKNKNKERIDSLIARARKEKGASVYTRLEVLFAMCAFLEDQSHMKLLSRYTAETDSILGQFVNHIPELDHFFLSQSADNYAAVGDHAKSIESDLRMLAVLDSLEVRYRNSGRHHRNTDIYRFRSYARIMSNYDALSRDSLEYYYGLIRDFAEKYPGELNADDYYKLKRSDIYYLMDKKRYREALPLIKEQLDEAPDLQFHIRISMVNKLIEAATAIGDRTSRDNGLDLYHSIMERNRSDRGHMHYVDLQTIYETNSFNIREAAFNVEQQHMRRVVEQQKGRMTRIIIAGVLVIVVILLGVIIVMIYLHRRMKRLNQRRAKDNVALMEERDTLKRTQAELVRASEQARSADRQREQFVNNVSNEFKTPVNAIVEYSQLIVDCIDDDKYRYLDRFASVVKLNAELLSMLINDVLDVASYDKGTLKIEKLPVSLRDVCTVAVDTVKTRVNPGVKLINEIDTMPDILIDTDAKRVAQVLMNLLGNAAKFTDEGTITLSGKLGDDGATYTFSVTDTGIGIPQGREEEIFQRFKKLNKYSQGVGLGLPVSRMLARLLGGDVTIDRDYKGAGSRFLFTITIK